MQTELKKAEAELNKVQLVQKLALSNVEIITGVNALERFITFHSLRVKQETELICVFGLKLL